MKNIFFALLAICTSLLPGVNNLNAQPQVAIEIPGFQNDRLERSKTIAAGDHDEISPKALKNFAHTYKNVQKVNWFKIKDGFFARFESGGIKNTILYTPGGKWCGSVKAYTEENMPRGIRDIVKSKYYDYSIYYVEELEVLESGHMPTYLIHMEDKTTIKLIRVFDSEMEVWKEFIKS